VLPEGDGVRLRIFWVIKSTGMKYLPYNSKWIDFTAFSQLPDHGWISKAELEALDYTSDSNIGLYAVERACNQFVERNLTSLSGDYEVIGYSAFSGCYVLTSVDLPNATSIGGRAFYDCHVLTSVDLPSATSIGWDAFSGCYVLTSVDLPNATSIGDSAFSRCEALTSVDLPNATSIGWDAFSGCTSLETLILRNAETVCNLMVSAIFNTKILTAEGMPTGEGFVYVPTVFYEQYVTNLVAQVVAGGYDEATATYLVTAVLRKIEDYPEICG
jgi:hypothetical protein